MRGSFVDTSALAKHYHVEPGSAQMDHLWADVGRTLFISRVGVVETISVFAGKVRSAVLSPSAFAVLRKRFLSDVGQGRPKLVRMLVQHFKDAERLVREHGLARTLRPLDALQSPLALDLPGRWVGDLLVSAAQPLLTAA